jgi:peptidoglycan/xylan/chitin deacetylase (PgdA/CDA1 family)
MEDRNKSKWVRRIGIGLLVTVMFLTVWVLNFYNVAKPINGISAVPVCSVDTELKQVALTFDCLSFGDEIQNIMYILDEFDAKATFFIPGKLALENRSAVLSLWAKGHDIGNMTYSYRQLGDAKANVIKSEIQECNATLQRITKDECTLFRAPYDDFGGRVVKTAAAMGMYSVRYDTDPLTWKPEVPVKRAVEMAMENVKPGSIFLFKTNGKFVEDTLREVLTRLRMKGYEAVKVSDMLFTEDFAVDVNGTQVRIEK